MLRVGILFLIMLSMGACVFADDLHTSRDASVDYESSPLFARHVSVVTGNGPMGGPGTRAHETVEPPFTEWGHPAPAQPVRPKAPKRGIERFRLDYVIL